MSPIRAIAIAAVLGTGILAGADAIAGGDAAGHVRYHAMVGLAALAVAVLPAWRARGSRRAAAPAIGLLLLAAAQLVEAVGGAGFDADNATRNDLAAIHDLGLGLTEIGLVAAVLGIAIGIRDMLAGRGVPNGIALGASVGFGGVGLLMVKTLIGL
jgi:hypothetical protein